MIQELLEGVRMSPVATVIFLITTVTTLKAFADPELKSRFILHPWAFVREKRYLTVITSGLIHADLSHFLFNIVAFWLYAFDLEHVFVMHQLWDMDGLNISPWIPSFLGHTKFFILYVGSMIIADLPTILRHKDDPAYASLGASGAISGVVISMMLFIPNATTMFGLQLWQFGLIYLAVSYIFSRRSVDNVNHSAHFWGALSGLVFTLIFFPKQALWLWYTILGAFGH